MELYQRVEIVAKLVGKGKKSLSDELGINDSTFRGYFSKERQNTLYDFLPKILIAHPEFSRNWLYFGEGSMLLTNQAGDEETERNLDEISRLHIELVKAKSEKDLAVANTKIEGLLKELARMEELVQAKDKAIDALTEQLSAQHEIPTIATETKQPVANTANTLSGATLKPGQNSN